MIRTANQEVLVHQPLPPPKLVVKYYFPATKIAKGIFPSLQLKNNCAVDPSLNPGFVDKLHSSVNIVV